MVRDTASARQSDAEYRSHLDALVLHCRFRLSSALTAPTDLEMCFPPSQTGTFISALVCQRQHRRLPPILRQMCSRVMCLRGIYLYSSHPCILGTYSSKWYGKNFSLIALSRERCCKVLRGRLVTSCTPQPADKKLYAKWSNCLFSVVALVQVDGLNVSAYREPTSGSFAWEVCVWLSCRTQQAWRHRTESRSFFKDFEAFHKKVHFTAQEQAVVFKGDSHTKISQAFMC